MTGSFFSRRKDMLAGCGRQAADYLEKKYGEHFVVLGARGESWGLPADRYWAKKAGDDEDGVFAVYGRYDDRACAFADAYYSVWIKPAYERFVHTLADRLLHPCTVQLTLNRESPNPDGLKIGVPLTDIHRHIHDGGPQFVAQVGLSAPASALRGQGSPAEVLSRIAEGFAAARLMAWLRLTVLTDGVAQSPVICYTDRDYQLQVPMFLGTRSGALLQMPAAETRLHDHQLERLCALVYLDGLLSQPDGRTLGEMVDYLLAYGLEDCKIKGRLPCEMTEAEWLRVLRGVRLDEALCALRILYTVDVTEACAAGGAMPGHRAVGFCDGQGTAYAVFRGTCGDDEWYDNALGMVRSDTTQQQAAADFVAALATMDGVRRVVTAGHSKGGNKAQYAAVTAPEGRVCYCFSLDGQGFSPAFMHKYRDAVEKRRGLISRGAERRDFVNCLGIYLSDGTVFRTGRRGAARPDAPHGDPLPYFHCPDALRDKGGHPGPITPNAPIPAALNRLVAYFLQDPRYDAQREETAVDLMSLLMENKRASTEETAEALVNIIAVCMDLLCNDPLFQKEVTSVVTNETEVLLASLDLAAKPRATAGRASDSLLTCVAERLALRVIKDKKLRTDLIGGIRFLIPLLKKTHGAQDRPETTDTALATLLARFETL